MTSSAHLQNQADQARAGLSTALDELRSSVTTTALTNGAMTLAKDGSSAVARAAIDRAMDNPLAALLIGAGLAMLVSGIKPGGSVADGGNGVLRKAVDTGADLAGGASSGLAGAASSALEAGKSAAGTIANSARSAAGQVSTAAHSAGDLATSSYAQARDMIVTGQEKGTQALHDAEQFVTQTKTRLEKFADEQPVLVAALGLAFGAALGASLPITDAERKFMGSASKAVTDKGTAIAGQVAAGLTHAVTGGDIKGKVDEVAKVVTSTVTDALKS